MKLLPLKGPKPGSRGPPGPGQVKRPSAREGDHGTGPERAPTPTSTGVEALAHTKYREKMYTQVRDAVRADQQL